MSSDSEKFLPLEQMLLLARKALPALSQASTDRKNQMLKRLATLLLEQKQAILTANQQDQTQATHDGLSPPMIDRMQLTENRIKAMSEGVLMIATLDDPVGQTIATLRPKSGLVINRVRVPIGLIAVIYESRPNVTIDAAALCFKSGNAVMLRGGKEAQHSNRILTQIFQQALIEEGFSPEIVQVVPSQDRALVGYLLKAQGLVDVVVPRGGKNLVARVTQEARVPLFAHLDGVVHIYVDQSANPKMAEDIIGNAKMRRTSICGAAECLLLHEKLCPSIIQGIFDRLLDLGCEIRGDDACCALDKRVLEAQAHDFGCEFSAPIIAAKMVSDQTEAVAHIAQFGSHHTDVIISDDLMAAEHFFTHVDSAIVMHNASSQFADGGEFGMGAEMGIATGRMHARGPIGLEQLTTFHYRVQGSGQTRPL